MNPSSLKVTGAWFQVGGILQLLLERQEDLLEKVESDLVIVGSSLQALGYILQIIASNYDDGEEKRKSKYRLRESK